MKKTPGWGNFCNIFFWEGRFGGYFGKILLEPKDIRTPQNHSVLACLESLFASGTLSAEGLNG